MNGSPQISRSCESSKINIGKEKYLKMAYQLKKTEKLVEIWWFLFRIAIITATLVTKVYLNMITKETQRIFHLKKERLKMARKNLHLSLYKDG